MQNAVLLLGIYFFPHTVDAFAIKNTLLIPKENFNKTLKTNLKVFFLKKIKTKEKKLRSKL